MCLALLVRTECIICSHATQEKEERQSFFDLIGVLQLVCGLILSENLFHIRCLECLSRAFGLGVLRRRQILRNDLAEYTAKTFDYHINCWGLSSNIIVWSTGRLRTYLERIDVLLAVNGEDDVS